MASTSKFSATSAAWTQVSTGAAYVYLSVMPDARRDDFDVFVGSTTPDANSPFVRFREDDTVTLRGLASTDNVWVRAAGASPLDVRVIAI